MERCFYIIGAGPGTPACLTEEARQAIVGADVVLSTARLAASLSAVRTDIAVCNVGALTQTAIDASARNTAVLVSGDSGFFSLARTLVAALSPHGHVEVLCGISSLQYFCARLQTSYDNMLLRSLHGRDGSPLGVCSYHPGVMFLSGGYWNATRICSTLSEAGMEHVRVSVGERLGDTAERIVCGTAKDLADQQFSDLAVVLVENSHTVAAHEPLWDRDFVRGAVPMTKQEVRWLAVQLLSPAPHETIYDIGAGTGSVSLELGRRVSSGLVYAIEQKPEALALLKENRVRLGGYNVCPIAACAPEGLEQLPAPDAAFVGGSGGKLADILTMLKARNPSVRVVISAISLDTLAEARQALAALGFASVEVCQIAASRGKTVGGHMMLLANNPVFLISGGGA